ncbi:MAG TPA: DmsC/YnfH family molybdoenzyme membrane anchor subunit [Acidobacteriota bacterium]|nr:DmsC/YnfH family molybdoenzyme membrane anchor subunit [Acidobacteriota bacterium]
MLKEWPLVAFTILGQTAAGVFLVFHLPFIVRGRLPGSGWRLTWIVTLALVALITAAAVLSSLFHLRHPLRARYALSNVRTSWLSREILFELAFGGLVVLEGGLAYVSPASRASLWPTIAAALLAGMFFVASMAKLYMLPSLPAWKGAYTPLSFFLTTLVLGALGTETIVRALAGPGAFDLNLSGAALLLIAAEILLVVVLAPRYGLRGVRPGPSLRPADDSPRCFHRARIVLLALGSVGLVADLATAGNDIMNEKGIGLALLLAFAFTLAGEVAGRFHFYGLVTQPGE